MSTPSIQISCTFAPKSLSLEVMDIEGKNYQLSIQTLAKEVNVEKSYCKAKNGGGRNGTKLFCCSETNIFFDGKVSRVEKSVYVGYCMGEEGGVFYWIDEVWCKMEQVS